MAPKSVEEHEVKKCEEEAQVTLKCDLKTPGVDARAAPLTSEPPTDQVHQFFNDHEKSWGML